MTPKQKLEEVLEEIDPPEARARVLIGLVKRGHKYMSKVYRLNSLV